MADLISVMLKSMGIDGKELTNTATNMQAMVADIHSQLMSIRFQNELIITHLAEFAMRASPIRAESERILTRMVLDGELRDESESRVSPTE
jgi:hypothetical protein